MTNHLYISTQKLQNILECAHVEKDLNTIKKTIAKIKHTDKPMSHFLLWACKEGLYDITKTILDSGEYDTLSYKDGLELEAACSHGHLDIVKLLISYGANPKNNDNKSMREASHTGQNVVIKYLHSIGCEINLPDVISDAVEKGNIPILEYLHHHQVSLTNYTNRIFLNIMHTNNIDLLNFTKKIGIEFDDDQQNTHLSLASRLGYINIIKELATTTSNWNNIISQAHDNIEKELILYKTSIFEKETLSQDINSVQRHTSKPPKL